MSSSWLAATFNDKEQVVIALVSVRAELLQSLKGHIPEPSRQSILWSVDARKAVETVLARAEDFEGLRQAIVDFVRSRQHLCSLLKGSNNPPNPPLIGPRPRRPRVSKTVTFADPPETPIVPPIEYDPASIPRLPTPPQDAKPLLSAFPVVAKEGRVRAAVGRWEGTDASPFPLTRTPNASRKGSDASSSGSSVQGVVIGKPQPMVGAANRRRRSSSGISQEIFPSSESPRGSPVPSTGPDSLRERAASTSPPPDRPSSASPSRDCREAEAWIKLTKWLPGSWRSWTRSL